MTPFKPSCLLATLLIVGSGCSGDIGRPLDLSPLYSLGGSDECPTCNELTQDQRSQVQQAINGIGMGPEPECAGAKAHMQYLLDTNQIAAYSYNDGAWAWSFNFAHHYGDDPARGTYRTRFYQGNFWSTSDLLKTVKHEGYHFERNQFGSADPTYETKARGFETACTYS